MIKIPELYNTLSRLVKKLIDILKCDGEYHTDFRKLSKGTVEGYLLDKYGKWSIGKVPLRILPHLFTYLKTKHLDRLASMQETKELLKELFEILLHSELIKYPPKLMDPEGKLVVGAPTMQDILFSGLSNGGVDRFIAQYLRRISVLGFDVKVFNECYSDFEDYHLSNVNSFTSVIPLLYFSSDIEVIEFSDEVKIVRLDPTEMTRLANIPFLGNPDSSKLEVLETIFGSGFAIKVAFSSQKDEPVSDKSARERARLLLTALRLLKPGHVSWNITFGVPTDFNPVLATPTVQYSIPLPSTRRKECLFLSAGESEILRNIWHSLRCLSQCRDQGKLDVGIRKFNDIYNRSSLEDRIIDMSILLESTLLYGIKDELAYRLSLRGAHLLKSNRDAKQTYKYLKKFYDLRSDIVHDGKRLDPAISIDGSELTAKWFVAEMETVCREILRAFVEKVAKGSSLGNINKGLDEEALRA